MLGDSYEYSVQLESVMRGSRCVVIEESERLVGRRERRSQPYVDPKSTDDKPKAERNDERPKKSKYYILYLSVSSTVGDVVDRTIRLFLSTLVGGIRRTMDLRVQRTGKQRTSVLKQKNKNERRCYIMKQRLEGSLCH